MKKREIEKRLNNIIVSKTPDVLEDILKDCKDKKGNIKVKMKENIKVEEKNSGFKRFIPAISGAFVLVFVCFLGLFGYNQNNKIDSVIEFDVNPSIEIKTNRKDEIIDVIALNEDGKKVIDGMDLEDVDLNVGVNAIIGSMLKNGYITDIQNAILVSVKNDNKTKSKELEKRITSDIQKIVSNSTIISQEYNDDDKISSLAKEYGISEGKANLISKVLKSGLKDPNGKEYEFSNLSSLTITELKLLLDSKEIKIDSVVSSGNASSKGLISEEVAKKTALDHAKLSNVKNLKIELDVEDGVLVYEVEFDFNNKEYEYDINAKTGEIIKIDIDEENNIDDNDEDDNNDYDDEYDDDDDDYDDDDDIDDDDDD